MIRRNKEIRAAAKSASVFLYEIAEKLGVSEPTFNRKLRKEFDEPTKRNALAAIEEIKREHEIEQGNISAAEKEVVFGTAEKN